MQVSKITSSVLESFFNEAKSEGQSRVQWLIEKAISTTEQEFRDAINDYKQVHENEAGISVRCSEASTLYFATINNIDLVGLGYHQAIAKGREQLKAMGLSGTGKPLRSEEEKQADKEARLRRKAYKEAEKVIDMGQPDALLKLGQQVELELAKLKAEEGNKALVKKFETVGKLVESIMGEGEDYAFEVIKQLANGLGFADVLEAAIEQSILDRMSASAEAEALLTGTDN